MRIEVPIRCDACGGTGDIDGETCDKCSGCGKFWPEEERARLTAEVLHWCLGGIIIVVALGVAWWIIERM